MRYRVGGPISYTLRGVEIELNANSIYRILGVPIVGLRIYESKVWPTIVGFKSKKVIQRICGLSDAHGMGKPSSHSLTIISRVFHHMLCFTFLPWGGHRDEVSYYEAFLMDSILTGRGIHLGYLTMMHMIACYESKTRVFPYRHFLSLVFKEVGIDLSKKTDFEVPSIYDIYNDQSMGMMKFEKAEDGSWIKKAERWQAQE